MTTTQLFQSGQLDTPIYTVFIDSDSNLGFEDDLGSDAEQASKAEVDEQTDWKEENLDPGDVLDLSDGLVRVDDQLNLVNPDKEDEQEEQETEASSKFQKNTIEAPVFAFFKDNDGKLDFVDNPDAIYMASKDEIDSQPDWKKKNLSPGKHLDLKEGVYKVDDKLNLFNPTKNNASLIEDGTVWYEPSEETKEEQQSNNVQDVAEDIKQKLPALTSIPKKQIFVGVATLIATVIVLRVLFAVLGAIASLPFLPTFFEVVGIGYTLWFAYRYLSTVEGREELQNKLTTLRNRIMS
jgi:hypothetical protein